MELPPTESTASQSPTEFFCPECGYDLRAITSERCPECGLAIDRASMSVSRIPWSHRKEIGGFRAYWRTSLLAVSRPKRIAEEMSRPVSYADAQRFRHMTVLLAWLPIAGWIVALMVINREYFPISLAAGERLGWCMEIATYLAGLFAIWLFLLMASGASSFFVHPKRLPVVLQNRAIALSFYAAAPLAWLWVPAVFLAIAALIFSADWSQHGFGFTLGMVATLSAVMLAVVLVILCWLHAAELVQRTTQAGKFTRIAHFLLQPIEWAIAAAIALLVPMAVVYVSLMILSLR